MPTPTRRRFIAGTAATALPLALAGCSSGGSGGDQTDTGDGHDDEHDDEHAGETTEHHDDEHDETATEHHDDGHDETTEGGDGHGHNHDEGTPEAPQPEAHVTLRTEDDEQHYDPHVAWVEVGGTVTWELESGQHDAVAYHPDNDKPRRMPADAEPWATDLLDEAGETASHTFETEGVYDYCCTPHESLGMVGTVIVGEPDAHDQPALEEPSDDLPEAARHELEGLATKVNEALGHGH